MNVTKLSESGYEEAMLGVSLSWASNPVRSSEIAPRLAHKQGGHNKFAESIIIWLDVTAPRYWWQEFDTYRVGVSKQSGSTMHTIVKQPLTQADFEHHINEDHIAYLNRLIELYNMERSAELFLQLKANLPEGFLQRRIVCLSYKALQNMYNQRKHHRLPEWQTFFGILRHLEYPEFVEE